MSWQFNRDKLPAAADYLVGEGIDFKNRGREALFVCPFHDDHKPSMYMELETGKYHCKSCDEKGGDIISFHMARTGMTFVYAATYLGAFDGDANSDNTKIHSTTPLERTIESVKRLGLSLYSLRQSTYPPHSELHRRIECFERYRLQFLGDLIDPKSVDEDEPMVDPWGGVW
jgi:hypothetical protein